MDLIYGGAGTALDTEERHLWALGNGKDKFGMTWSDIADVMNKTWRDDETQYYTESAYRKRYTQAKEILDKVVLPEMESSMTDAKEYADEIQRQRERLYEEKVRMWDARRAYNKAMRDSARHEENLTMLGAAIKRQGEAEYIIKPRPEPVAHTDNDILCCISDIHYGIEFDSHTGRYNSDVAKKRMSEYANEVIEVGKRHSARNVYITLLGDALSGAIHHSLQVENRENVIDQIIGVSGMVSDFVYAMSLEYDNVYFNAVGGNHSRLQPKDMAVKDERLDNLIVWYIGSKFEHMPNVHVTPLKDNIDSTVAMFEIHGKKFVSVHGDYDAFTGAGMSKLVMWLGYKPYAIVSGHRHTPSFMDVAGIMCVQSGSLSGSGDDYTVSHRLSGYPSQTVCVLNAGEITAIYPVRLRAE